MKLICGSIWKRLNGYRLKILRLNFLELGLFDNNVSPSEKLEGLFYVTIKVHLQNPVFLSPHSGGLRILLSPSTTPLKPAPEAGLRVKRRPFTRKFTFHRSPIDNSQPAG
jgi:hypothetical protein